mgnify:CR=1 FL=1
MAPPETVATPAATLTSLDPDSYFKGKTGGTFGKDASKVLPGSKRVAVTGFRVIFVTGNTIKAQVRASYFGGVDRSGANAIGGGVSWPQLRATLRVESGREILAAILEYFSLAQIF